MTTALEAARNNFFDDADVSDRAKKRMREIISAHAQPTAEFVQLLHLFYLMGRTDAWKKASQNSLDASNLEKSQREAAQAEIENAVPK